MKKQASYVAICAAVFTMTANAGISQARRAEAAREAESVIAEMTAGERLAD